jgi:hypothetical protein
MMPRIAQAPPKTLKVYVVSRDCERSRNEALIIKAMRTYIRAKLLLIAPCSSLKFVLYYVKCL